MDVRVVCAPTQNAESEAVAKSTLPHARVCRVCTCLNQVCGSYNELV